MPAVTPIPVLPIRSSMTDEDFSEQVGATFAAIPLFITELNAAIAAMNLNSTNATSTTSLLIANAAKSLTVETGKSYVPGQTLKIASTAGPTNWMVGDVTAYNIATGLLSVSVQYKQGSGTFAAWTISLSPPVPVTIPSGSNMFFSQAVAPVGWTQTTSNNNMALRIVNDASGGATAGTVDFTTAFASKSVAGSNSATTLDTTQIPAHSHVVTGLGSNSPGSANIAFWGASDAGPRTVTSANAGGGLSHNHTFTGTAINLAVKYMNTMLASKD